jgi:hypothetical protein
MFPGIDPDTLLFNLYVDVFRFFDNSDGVITLDTLKRKVVNAMKMNWEQLLAYCNWEIQYWHKNRPKFICKSGIITTRGQLSYIGKRIRWANLDEKYDRTKSIRENMELLGVPKSTLYEYCNEKWIDTNPNHGMTKEEKRKARREDKASDIELFKRLYNPNLSVRKNMAFMEENGLKIGKSTIARWINDYYTEPVTTNLPKITLPEMSWSFLGAENYSYTSSSNEDFEYSVSDWDLQDIPQSQDSFFGRSVNKWGLPEITFEGFFR